MSIVARTAIVLTLAGGFAAIYAVRYMNLGIPLYNGCTAQPGTGNIRFKAFPPHYSCQYRTEDGRVVERSW